MDKKINITYQLKKTWVQDNTSQLVKVHYCVEENQYITKPLWDICEICNGEIKK